MPRTVQKTLRFPLAGVARRRGYRDHTKERPYAAPWAMNVRGEGPLESRDRGGSRPGLTKANATKLGTTITALLPLTSIDASNALQHDLIIIADGILSYLRGAAISTVSADLQWPDADTILWDDGEDIVFDATVSTSSPIGSTGAYHAATRGGKLYLADSVLRVYDPNTGIIDPVTATDGTLPTSEPLVCLYRDRLILAGKNNIWHASRTSDVADYNYGAEATDINRAVSGQLEHAGGIGAVPKAVIPHRDDVLVLACANSLWALRGDPTTGNMKVVSSEIGILAPKAWAKTPDGLMAFLSNDGVYVWDMGSSSKPTRFSEERLPDELKNISATDNIITMAYDSLERGFHLFITPTDGTTHTHWWLDIKNRAMWPVSLHADHQPLAVARLETTGLADTLLGCKDGYLRKFSNASETDDSRTLNSHVLLGPFRIARNDTEDAMLSEIHGIMADNDDFVDWRVVMGDSAEEVADTAVTGINAVINGESPKGVSADGRWEALRNKVARARSRGPWMIVWLSAVNKWSYEAVAIKAEQLGRLR